MVVGKLWALSVMDRVVRNSYSHAPVAWAKT